MSAFEGARVLVVGATRGLGRAIADQVLLGGAEHVVVTGRTVEDAAVWAESKRAAGNAVSTLCGDLSDLESCRGVVEAATRAAGGLDALVLAGATSMRTPLTSTTPAQLEKVFRTNTMGPYLVIAGFVAHLLAERRPGSIVAVTSMSAHGGQPYLPAYSASKAALVALIRNVAHAHRFDRIRANAINLGMTDTPGADEEMRGFHGRSRGWRAEAASAQPQGRLISPDDAARAVCFLLGKDSLPTTGTVMDFAQRVIGGAD